jgi:large subunit ribosomal protein L7/L12
MRSAKKSQLLNAGAEGEASLVPASTRSVYGVVLQSSGPKKIQVIKVMRAAMGLGLKQAKELVDSAPVPLGARIGHDAACSLQRQLEDAGATVVLNPR